MSFGRGRFGGGESNRGFGQKPVQTGKEYDLRITEISRQGDGIARVQGFVIFVKGGKVGQNAKVRITNVGARFATGEIVEPAAAGQAQEQQAQQPARDFAPAVSEEEKPDLQDYKSKEPEAGGTTTTAAKQGGELGEKEPPAG